MEFLRAGGWSPMALVTIVTGVTGVMGCGGEELGDTFGEGVSDLGDLDDGFSTTSTAGGDESDTDMGEGEGESSTGGSSTGTGTDDEASADSSGEETSAGSTSTGEDEEFAHDNIFGIGLVAPGDQQQLDLAANLAGKHGGVRLTFAGITKDMHAASDEWKQAVQLTYDRDLVPYVRLGPPWGDRRVRNQSDDGAHANYAAYAQAYADTVASLPKREGWPLYVEVHNEPNLCYEWACDAGDQNDGWLGYQVAAAEYAHMLADVADALHGLGDARIKVMNGGLAPGGTVSCECGGDGYEAGITSIEYIQAMLAAEPGLAGKLDAWASHSYPAEGKGWGFFVAYDGVNGQAQTGLVYYQDELAAIGAQLPVVMTETGWTTEYGSQDQVASWTVNAYNYVWLADAGIQAILPFQLMDASWDAFAWADTSGNPRPVYNAVRQLRCDLGVGGGC
ncbi:hypothetical protein G6O69_17655 [Pseudenhygromyxa sp. WMMC2535]|uniref:hypothetical protein n=1 Tax=Pseudenhygromyxa sp. WMMC2535 TaxID=2712867 RepID=UPI001551B34D|nr:hypothetical protein [Pseudenhygromyxa sp. WMMC2535]NVB39673.1 hypothetical protein [Pseudenhygromyxa sp. WMMC2535]